MKDYFSLGEKLGGSSFQGAEMYLASNQLCHELKPKVRTFDIRSFSTEIIENFFLQNC